MEQKEVSYEIKTRKSDWSEAEMRIDTEYIWRTDDESGNGSLSAVLPKEINDEKK